MPSTRQVEILSCDGMCRARALPERPETAAGRQQHTPSRLAGCEAGGPPARPVPPNRAQLATGMRALAYTTEQASIAGEPRVGNGIRGEVDRLPTPDEHAAMLLSRTAPAHRRT